MNLEKLAEINIWARERLNKTDTFAVTVDQFSQQFGPVPLQWLTHQQDAPSAVTFVTRMEPESASQPRRLVFSRKSL